MTVKPSTIKLLLTTTALFSLLISLYLLSFRNSGTVLSATAGHLVISELQITGDGGVDDEFVELYNPTASDIVMDSWRLTRKNSSGTEANLVSVLSGTVPAHGFFLITDADGYNGATSGDANYSATSNQMTNNYTVLLYSDAGVTLVDKVGFGTAADFENAAFADNPGSESSIERKPGDSSPSAGNGEDTDDNSNDFLLRQVSDPQNSESPAEIPVSPTLTETTTATVTLTPTVELTPTTEVSPTLEPTPTTEPTPSLEPTNIPTPTDLPTVTPTQELTPTLEPTPTAMPTPTLEPTPTPVEHFLSVFSFPHSTTVCKMTLQKFKFFFGYMYFPQVTCYRV